MVAVSNIKPKRMWLLPVQAGAPPTRGRGFHLGVEAWVGLGVALLAFADRPDTLGEQRDLYEELLAQFPTAVSHLLLPVFAPTTGGWTCCSHADQHTGWGCVWPNPLWAL